MFLCEFVHGVHVCEYQYSCVCGFVCSLFFTCVYMCICHCVCTRIHYCGSDVGVYLFRNMCIAVHLTVPFCMCVCMSMFMRMCASLHACMSVSLGVLYMDISVGKYW